MVRAQANHKGSNQVWKSIFSTVLVMSAVQNESLKNELLCQSGGASLYITETC